MKKPLCACPFWKRKRFNVIFLTMKLLTVLIFAGTMAVSASNSYSQKTKLDLQMQNASVSDILRTIESNSEFIFIYDASVINASAKRSVSVKGEKLENVLDQLFKGTNVAYKIDDRQVLLFTSDLKTLNPLSSGAQQAQRKTVTGTVKDSKGQPIPGVSVIVKGTTTGMVTDMDGKFSLEVPADARTLVFSFVGMDQQEVIITGRTSVDVTMQESVLGLGEVVVVGYGTQKKVDLTGSVSTVSVKEYEKAPVTDVLDAMQGKVAGVTIISNSGEPGAEKEIRIRGIQSWGADITPLYVIDGVIMDGMGSVNPNDIETISVLKDAASCAIYGARAANGVVLITTKRGSKGAPVITFSAYAGVQAYSDLLPKRLNTQQWLMLDRESYINAGTQAVQASPWGNQIPVDWNLFVPYPQDGKMQVKLDPITITDANGTATATGVNQELVNTDWLDINSQTGKIQNYDIALSGGSDKSNYFTSASYMKQDGLVRNTGADRISFRFNSNTQITDFIEFGNSVNIYSTSRFGGVGNPNPYFQSIRKNPISRPYERDPANNYDIINYDYVRLYTWEGGDVGPLIYVNEYTNETRTYGITGNLFLKVKILPGLTFTPRISVDYRNSHNTAFSPELHILRVETRSTNNVSKQQDYTMHWIADYMFNYERTFNTVHNVSAAAIYSQEESTYEYLGASRNGTPNNSIQYLNAGQQEGESIWNGMQDWSFVSYIGRVGYNYSGKYYIQGSVRRDGTSRFAEENRWGTFPSVSAGWRISKEKFWEPISKIVNDLKIRASYGTLGNSNVGIYPTYATLYPAYAVMGLTNGQSARLSYALGAAVNKNLKWESTLKKDIGFDANFFNSKLNLTVDYYKSNTTDLLYGKPIPYSAGKYSSDGWGSSDPTINGGEIENHGWEFTAGWQDKKGDWTYNINGNLSIARNSVVDLQGRNVREWGLEVGKPIYSFFGYQSNGIVKTQAELDAHPYLTNPDNDFPIGLGDIWTVDIDGRDANGNLTGKPDGKITADDRGFIGKKYPDFTYGLSGNVSYKRWTLQVVGYGVQGVDLNTMSDINGYFQYTSNEPVRILDRWEKTLNPNGNMPKVTKADYAGNSTHTASFWLSDASFFKINNINLTYNVPDDFCKKIKMSKLEVYGSANNVITFTNYPGGEVDVTDQGMWTQPVTKIPQPRTWVFGIKASF
jgi:TonB-dependent starch-binding outer membrane protein SusC